MKETILKTQNVTKRYAGKAVIANISTTIQKSDIYGLIGRNGARKTTLARIITTLTFADSWKIGFFTEKSDGGLNIARRRMECVVEVPTLYPNLSAFQNLKYYCILR